MNKYVGRVTCHDDKHQGLGDIIASCIAIYCFDGVKRISKGG